MLPHAVNNLSSITHISCLAFRSEVLIVALVAYISLNLFVGVPKSQKLSNLAETDLILNL